MWRNRFYTSSPIFPGIGMIYIIHINMKGFKASPELTLLNLSSDVKSRYLSKILQNLAADWHLQRGLITFFLNMSLFSSHSFYPSFLLWFDSFKTLEIYISGYFFNVSMHTHDTRCKELFWKLQSSQSLPSTYQVEVTIYLLSATQRFIISDAGNTANVHFSAALYIGRPQLLGLSLSLTLHNAEPESHEGRIRLLRNRRLVSSKINNLKTALMFSIWNWKSLEASPTFWTVIIWQWIVSYRFQKPKMESVGATGAVITCNTLGILFDFT